MKEKMKEIIADLKSGKYTNREIAKRHGVSINYVALVRLGFYEGVRKNEG